MMSEVIKSNLDNTNNLRPWSCHLEGRSVPQGSQKQVRKDEVYGFHQFLNFCLGHPIEPIWAISSGG